MNCMPPADRSFVSGRRSSGGPRAFLHNYGHSTSCCGTPTALCLERHHEQLKALSSASEMEEALCALVQQSCEGLAAVQGGFLELLAAAKEGGDVAEIRRMGQQVNLLKADIADLNAVRKQITGKRNRAQRLTAGFRAVHPIKEVDPTQLTEVEPSAAGYQRILDFYRFTDAALYNFGRVYSGPNFFTDVKSNVAILDISDSNGRRLYNQYAVSGDRCCPGAQLQPGGPFTAIECLDGLGETYSRDFDAEFKLLTEFAVSRASGWDGHGAGTLWSKKPLCESCAGVVRGQFPSRFPDVKLHVIIGAP
eukprot:TRINITY_DN14751_c0_g1_i1.p1 TRINITY_DN14751_c0_g1~~TRINITY_DN14751_c0_g1_i1.p1  ORF type:complete len:307 (-),score=53.36 TRINITY_DN14751_c0_g1_i1:51-971(-)